MLERFLASYWTTRTRANYRFTLTRWLDWCHGHRLDPVGGADAAALEAFIAELKTVGYAPNTIVGRISAVSPSRAGIAARCWSTGPADG